MSGINRGHHEPEKPHEHGEDQLEALLDEALAPPAELPPGMDERIIAASVEASVEAHLQGVDPQPIPMPRDEGRWARRVGALALAAALALAVVGAWALFEPATSFEPRPANGIAALERELSELQWAAGSAVGVERVDEQIGLLALQLELTQGAPLWPSADPLDEFADDAHAYQLMHEWDLAWVY